MPDPIREPRKEWTHWPEVITFELADDVDESCPRCRGQKTKYVGCDGGRTELYECPSCRTFFEIDCKEWT